MPAALPPRLRRSCRSGPRSASGAMALTGPCSYRGRRTGRPGHHPGSPRGCRRAYNPTSVLAVTFTTRRQAAPRRLHRLGPPGPALTFPQPRCACSYCWPRLPAATAGRPGQPVWHCLLIGTRRGQVAPRGCATSAEIAWAKVINVSGRTTLGWPPATRQPWPSFDPETVPGLAGYELVRPTVPDRLRGPPALHAALMSSMPRSRPHPPYLRHLVGRYHSSPAP